MALNGILVNMYYKQIPLSILPKMLFWIDKYWAYGPLKLSLR